MAAGRLYDVSFSKLSVSVAAELLLIKASASVPFELLSLTIAPVDGASTTEILSMAIRKYASGYTAGTGGSAGTMRKRLVNDAAAATTFAYGNTTATTGTVEDEIDDAWNEINGYQLVAIPGTEMACEPSAAIAVQLLTEPGAARVVSAAALIREIL